MAATNVLVGNGICYEVNPWIEYLINKHGVYKALALSKFPGLLLVAFLGLYRLPPRWAAFSMFIVAWLYALVLAWHLYIICYTKIV